MKIRVIVLIWLFFCLEFSQTFASEPANLASVSRIRRPLQIEDFRFGGGVGYGFYVTNQMDYVITTNFGEFKELIPSYFGSIYKSLNRNFEVGLQFRNGHLLTLKSENT